MKPSYTETAGVAAQGPITSQLSLTNTQTRTRLITSWRPEARCVIMPCHDVREGTRHRPAAIAARPPGSAEAPFYSSRRCDTLSSHRRPAPASNALNAGGLCAAECNMTNKRTCRCSLQRGVLPASCNKTSARTLCAARGSWSLRPAVRSRRRHGRREQADGRLV